MTCPDSVLPDEAAYCWITTLRMGASESRSRMKYTPEPSGLMSFATGCRFSNLRPETSSRTTGALLTKTGVPGMSSTLRTMVGPA